MTGDDCTCYAPDDAEPYDHDHDCPGHSCWAECPEWNGV